MSYANIREEELKNKISKDYFWMYDCTKIIGNVDFCVSMLSESSNSELELDHESLFWAEAKKGISDIQKSIVQLILTIGKARTFDKFLPPAFLGAFDSEKIAFIPYSEISEIFYQNDFNWNVTPSNYETKEFKNLLTKVTNLLNSSALLFNYETDSRELNKFIKDNFVVGKFGVTKTQIDKNNFMIIYNKWLGAVKPTIAVNWDIVKKSGIIDGDFFLADLLSQENITLKEKLFVLLKNNYYELDRKINDLGLFNSSKTGFSDNQKAHTQFWLKYERPPKEEYWDYIVERRDLLVPQDVRERKGSFFTPQIWVELSQKYLTDALGVDWQDEYYIWDCAAGTGNLLAGLTNKHNIYASTLDTQDVEVMKDRIQNGANLLEANVFQFDFLNDDFSKLPTDLLNIINDSKKNSKLLIYINPPYAEATSAKTVTGTGKNKSGVSKDHKLNEYFNTKIGSASNEIFALFMAKIYEKTPNAVLGQFSTLKFVQGANFTKFKNFFLAKFLGGFIVPATTFDNVEGSFPIGFTLWDLKEKRKIETINCEIYEKNITCIGVKNFFGVLPLSINKWLVTFYYKKSLQNIGTLSTRGNDFQNQKYIYLATKIDNIVHDTKVKISTINLFPICIYFSVRHCKKATWLNDRDQFLFPNDGWKTDFEFQNDCLTFILFHSQNKISSKVGTNHWIPFTEIELNARKKLESSFMADFISGKIKKENSGEIFEFEEKTKRVKLIFSKEAQIVFDAGKALWIYYHKQPNCNVNASLYDIREYFQGRNDKRMNNKSEDDIYSKLMEDLRESLKILASKIEPKVYEYGFL
ncbi:MAG: hypothetical protein EAZ27_09885, partial [Cytophagales bacterium]